jgi:hypothetical protein
MTAFRKSSLSDESSEFMRWKTRGDDCISETPYFVAYKFCVLKMFLKKLNYFSLPQIIIFI